MNIWTKGYCCGHFVLRWVLFRFFCSSILYTSPFLFFTALILSSLLLLEYRGTESFFFKTVSLEYSSDAFSYAVHLLLLCIEVYFKFIALLWVSHLTSKICQDRNNRTLWFFSFAENQLLINFNKKLWGSINQSHFFCKKTINYGETLKTV